MLIEHAESIWSEGKTGIHRAKGREGEEQAIYGREQEGGEDPLCPAQEEAMQRRFLELEGQQQDSPRCG